MDVRKILKTVVAINWIINIAYLYASKDSTWVSDVGIVLSLLIPITLIAYIILTIGLFFIKPWAKWPFTILVAIDLILTYFGGPLSVHKSNLVKVIGYLEAIDTIVILCLLFFTNVMPKKKDRAIG